MEKKTLSNIMEGKIFIIPDYQRGYAWERKQWKDFVQDIDALIDEEIEGHYTGTIVIFQKTTKPTENYGTKKLEKVEVVDGQQRLTTCSLYLSIVLNELVKRGEDDFKSDIQNLLINSNKTKLRLNNDTSDFYTDLISKGTTNVKAVTVHEIRLKSCYDYLKAHVVNELKSRNTDGLEYLKELFDAITRKLNFSFYSIEKESEIGMTFELMNSRGKSLSSLELLKNYLMHWIYRNSKEAFENEDMTKVVNKSWKEVYTNVASCNGSESQCLRIAWTLYCSPVPKNWKGYGGFKDDKIIPLRNFSLKTKEETKEFISMFSNGLAEISYHYAAIVSPSKDSLVQEEYNWLNKIINAGNIANYLPLMIAVRKKVFEGNINHVNYIAFLKAIELYSYRVFMWAGKRSNTGLSKFYNWSNDILYEKHSIETVTNWILGTINWYSYENIFRLQLKEELFSWYHNRRLLKYTLYEYELWLLKSEGKGNSPKLQWSDLTDATLEHILPQNPKADSQWLKDWSDPDIKKYLHDISNIVLTKDNSHYLNFDFNRKKGLSGDGHCYANSDIRQERQISKFDEWNADSCIQRRETLVSWIIERWGITQNYEPPNDIFEEEEEEVEF